MREKHFILEKYYRVVILKPTHKIYKRPYITFTRLYISSLINIRFPSIFFISFKLIYIHVSIYNYKYNFIVYTYYYYILKKEENTSKAYYSML